MNDLSYSKRGLKIKNSARLAVFTLWLNNRGREERMKKYFAHLFQIFVETSRWFDWLRSRSTSYLIIVIIVSSGCSRVWTRMKLCEIFWDIITLFHLVDSSRRLPVIYHDCIYNTVTITVLGKLTRLLITALRLWFSADVLQIQLWMTVQMLQRSQMKRLIDWLQKVNLESCHL